MNTDKYLNKYKAQIKDKASFDRNQQKVSGKLNGMKRGPVAKIWDQVLMLWDYVRDPKRPWTAKILPLAGLVYLISPVDAIPDVIPGLGLTDDVGVLVLIIRTITDAAFSAASAFALKKFLAGLNAKAYKNFIISAALNVSMLLCLVFVVVFMRELKDWGILAAALINYIMLGRALFNAARFFRTVLVPHHRIIAIALPVFFSRLVLLKSLRRAIQDTIVAVYEEKLPSVFKIGHQIASKFGLIKNRDEMITNLYPLVCRFLSVVIYNVLLFTVCYGLLISIVKRFVIGTMLNMSLSFVDFIVYPVVYIAGIILK
ncbi:MAG: DUF1232 domain-containing protein [Treponema sp.]|jgi:uncharacterized membrane protein YkvA (DUF1232 family)|nr:DUF1232 domain-containing protein [Treponema sp.]